MRPPSSSYSQTNTLPQQLTTGGGGVARGEPKCSPCSANPAPRHPTVKTAHHKHSRMLRGVEASLSLSCGNVLVVGAVAASGRAESHRNVGAAARRLDMIVLR